MTKVFIIAEACDNHFGKMHYAKEMVVQAKLAGADAIKFQHHLPDEEMLKSIPMSDNFKEPLYDFLVKNALKLEHHIELSQFCSEVGIEYMCTPFSYKAAVEIVKNTQIKRIKIGSGEMTDIPSLKRMAEFGIPMILSTGMCTFDEIEMTYNALVDRVKGLSLLNCTSEYPPVYEDINLRNIQTMINKFPRATIGHSDHTPDLYTCYAAVALGAKIIEKHVILDKKMPGPDQSVSIDFFELRQLVDGIRKVELSMGEVKKVNEKEKIIREWAFRSVVSVIEIKKGTKITEEMVWTKRPGTGIPSRDMDKVIGKTAITDIPENTLLAWDQLK